MPTRGTTELLQPFLAQLQFQSTCPRGARRHVLASLYRRVDFNPRAHEGHDSQPARMCARRVISIHVPTRGTTIRDTIRNLCSEFQSTCPRGARRVRLLGCKCLLFQSTCPRGARHYTNINMYMPDISIHVPTRGTTNLSAKRACRRYFNPRAHEGHDGDKVSPVVGIGFQSTCPRGARRYAIESASGEVDFNPRAHEGHDVALRGQAAAAVFQSTCPRGARPSAAH